MDAPIYTLSPVADYADLQEALYLEKGYSPKFAAARKAAILDRGVQVKNGYEANAHQSGREALKA